MNTLALRRTPWRLFSTHPALAMPYDAIDHSAMPHVVLAGQREQLPWHHGPHFTSRLAAGYTRASDFGLLFGRTRSSRLRPDMGLWHSEVCSVSREGLCEQMSGDRSQMLFLPQGVVEIPEDFSRLLPNSFSLAFPNGSSCEHKHSGRVATQHDNRYEVSLCDLVDGKLDLVYDNAAGRIYWRQDNTGLTTKIFVSLLAVYIVSCVAENMKNMISNKPAGDGQHQHAVLVATVLFLGYELWWHDLASCIVTHSELDLFTLLYVYCILECFLQHDAVCVCTLRSKISPLTVCLLLLLLRVYYTFDTPYTLPLTILFGTRNWYKVLCLRLDKRTRQRRFEKLLVCLDLLVYAALLSAGIQQHAASPVQGACDQILTLALSTLIGTVLYIYSFVFEGVNEIP